ncbi:MAG: DNA repair exonuclease [Spirochaetes bacterium]|nr:DNA repair exonuclease [Spirochaetota bacterium]
MTFLHVADLHLSVNEKEYSFSVFREVLKIAIEEKCQWILICGDLFDSWEDLIQLREEVRNMVQPYNSEFQIFFVPGNHELGKNPQAKEQLKKLDLGTIQVWADTPFTVKKINSTVELMVVPYSRGPLEIEGWQIPPKQSTYRILAAHGMVPGVVYQGQEEEELGVLDLPIFQRFQIDYAALGHLHLPFEDPKGTIPFIYPGSARVWRAGEEGPRRVVIWEIEGKETVSKNAGSQLSSVTLRKRVLGSAGRFLSVDVEVKLNGTIPEPLVPEDIGKADWIQLNLVGITEDERKTKQQAELLRVQLEKRVRKVTVDSTRLEWIEGLSNHPLAQRFLSLWEDRYRSAEGEEKEILRYARLHGLRAIQEIRGARR